MLPCVRTCLCFALLPSSFPAADDQRRRPHTPVARPVQPCPVADRRALPPSHAGAAPRSRADTHGIGRPEGDTARVPDTHDATTRFRPAPSTSSPRAGRLGSCWLGLGGAGARAPHRAAAAAANDGSGDKNQINQQRRQRAPRYSVRGDDATAHAFPSC